MNICSRMKKRIARTWLPVMLVATLSGLAGCPIAPVGCIDEYDPSRAYDGYTMHSVIWTLQPFRQYLSVIDMQGVTVWSYSGKILSAEFVDFLQDAEVMPNGHILTGDSGDNSCLFEIDPSSNDVVWEYCGANTHHDADVLPNGNILFLYQYSVEAPHHSPFVADGIRIIDPSTNETLWDWRSEDHISMNDYCPLCIETRWSGGITGSDWLHTNALVYREETGGDAIYANFRNLNRLCKIDVATGNLVWCLGDGGDFGEGLFSHGHDPEFLPNGNILLFDNGRHRDVTAKGDEFSRAIEIAFDPDEGWAEIVWEYRGATPFYSSIMGDANRLPNGNVLITDGENSRIVEVTQDQEVVWQYNLFDLMNSRYRIYKAERLDSWPASQVH